MTSATKKTEYKLLDTSAWLALLYESAPAVKTIVEEHTILFTSTLSLFEIKRKLHQWNIPPPKIKGVLDYLKLRSIILAVDPEIAELAATLSFQRKLGAIDSLIYATATTISAVLITADRDFANLPNVEIL